ncbi:MAG: DUF1177 domain-containing protein [Sedimentibacter sp.]|uniref:DUF1177 domain-containing protein n=1 Tax=Sedimentibacter sp. TaxID=1960295 RepID=UPI0031591983
MMLKQVIDLFELLDKPSANGEEIAEIFRLTGIKDVSVKKYTGSKGSTDFISIRIPGKNGKCSGGSSPTLGIIGRLGGLGARPELIGFVSDGDGALAALSTGLKLAVMHKNGDVLDGDVIVATHICPDAPTREHFPVPFMDSPVEISDMNDSEVSEEMDAILSIDTTKGNSIITNRGFAISPTVKEGCILKVSDDIVQIMMRVTGQLAKVFPLSQQDITPYGNGLFHLNSILQPSTATSSPVIGVAITTEVPVAGCATGATHLIDVESAARFAVEVAKDFGSSKCKFYDEDEFNLMARLYGSMTKYQKGGQQ